MRRLCLPLLLAAVALVAPGRAAAQVIDGPIVDPAAPREGPPPIVGEVAIAERLGERVSPETRLTDASGRTVRVGDYLNRGRPVVVAFVYHSCPMLCSLILDGYATALAESDLVPGEDYEALAVSFDHRDTVARAGEAKAKYLAEAGNRAGLAEHWRFLVGEEDEVRRLADETGFGYQWDPVQGEYAHNAALIVLAPDGTVTRYLYGVSFAERDFRLALVEAGQGQVGSTLDRFLLTCYQYDPHRRTYTPVVMNIMKGAGGLLLLALGTVLFRLWRRERGGATRTEEPRGGLAAE